MNKPDILSIARQQLCDAISNFQTPTCDPLNVSPWIAMSLLQKAIRRGHEQLALRAAATLLRTSPERLWRRLGCISFEDARASRTLSAHLGYSIPLDSQPTSRLRTRRSADFIINDAS
jgi:hypothetical protein